MATEVDHWPVSYILDQIKFFGVPHFQRGMVWGSDSQAALLESLYFDTPCGSFVLWRPNECASKGVPLDRAAFARIEYLIIDGQQRIRSLNAVFSERADSDDEGEEKDGQDSSPKSGKKIWCINLTKVPDYAHRLKALDRDFAMFLFANDPALGCDIPPSPLRHNTLPLKLVLEARSWFDPALDPYRGRLIAKKGEQLSPADMAALYERLQRTVCAMKERKFSVSIQNSDDAAEMVNVYNRINAGGKRVDVEERAFARMVGLQPRTYDELRLTFDAVPARVRSGSNEHAEAELERDEVLQRKKERAFGFKLFMRVFLQVCNYHLGFGQNKADASFDLTTRGYFVSAVRRLGDQQYAELWAEARQIIGYVRGLLRDELRCDDLRLLPETQSLSPIFQLLIVYPALQEERYRPLLASLCLRLMLAELDTTAVLRLVADAADRQQVAFRVIPKMHRMLDEVNRAPRLLTRLQQANSIQSRYVLLLYWLERFLGARDFLYAQLRDEKKKAELGPSELAIDETVEPEKQHVLPFQKAQLLYSGEIRRGGSHIVNSVGNLTYISRKLNSFDIGLGEVFADLGNEPEENRNAHLLGQRVLYEYERLRRELGDNEVPTAKREKFRKVFERMVRCRREAITEAFLAWSRRVDDDACTALGIAGMAELGAFANIPNRMEPTPPKFRAQNNRDLVQRIRDLDLSHENEDRLLLLAQVAKVPPQNRDRQEIVFQLTRKRKRIWIEASRERIALRFDSIVSSDHRRQVVESLGLDSSATPIEVDVPLEPLPDLQGLLELMKQLGPKVDLDASKSA